VAATLLLAFVLLGQDPSPFTRLSPQQQSTAAAWLQSLTLRQRIAQLMIAPFFGEAPFAGGDDDRAFLKLVEGEGVGGLIILNRVVGGSVQRAEPYQMAAFLNRMQRRASIPLLVAGDFERSASMRVQGVTAFPHAMAFGAANDPALTRRFGEATACEAWALGVHWVLAPSADLNRNPDNPVIHLRSFGEDPAQVSLHVRAFLDGLQRNARCPVPGSVKHFPGHGDTNVDSHYGLPTIARTRQQLDESELAPFRAAINAGVYSVMPGHLSIPAMGTGSLPATVAKAIVTDLLKGEMGFPGLVTTDGLDMRGLSSRFPAGEASVRALEAGADVLMIPPDPVASLNAIEAALRSGRLTEERLNRSVLRVLQLKAALGLDAKRTVDLEAIAEVIPSPDFQQLAETVAARALTLVRNHRQALPFQPGGGQCAMVLNRGRFTTDGRAFATAVQELDAKAKVWFVDETMSDAAFAQLQRDSSACRAVAVASFHGVSVTPSPGANGAGSGGIPLPPRQAALLKAVEASPARVVLAPFANPYLGAHFPKASAVLVPFSSVPTSERATAQAIYGRTPIAGRSPVRLPGQLELGEGLVLSMPAPRR
jgi:beta-N-acetylhexosaminidase